MIVSNHSIKYTIHAIHPIHKANDWLLTSYSRHIHAESRESGDGISQYFVGKHVFRWLHRNGKLYVSRYRCSCTIG